LQPPLALLSELQGLKGGSSPLFQKSLT
jgi:hypothetical protein